MSTKIRPNISTANKYWIGRHRYYELKHFCLQYNEWKDELKSCKLFGSRSIAICNERPNYISDRTGDAAVKLEELESKISMVDHSAELSDPDLKDYIIKSVSDGVSYTYLSGIMHIPCCRESFYKSYRKFFYILSSVRG